MEKQQLFWKPTWKSIAQMCINTPLDTNDHFDCSINCSRCERNKIAC